GLFVINPDGSISLNGGTFDLVNLHGSPATLTTTVIPGPVGTPEPVTLALLGAGGLALAGLRRRKRASTLLSSVPQRFSGPVARGFPVALFLRRAACGSSTNSLEDVEDFFGALEWGNQVGAG